METVEQSNPSKNLAQLEDLLAGCLQRKREVVKLTGSYFNNMANSAHEAEFGDKMVDSLDRLANAAVQKIDDIERLSHSIATLRATVNSQSKDISRLHDIIASFAPNKSQPADNSTPGTRAELDPNGYCW